MLPSPVLLSRYIWERATIYHRGYGESYYAHWIWRDEVPIFVRIQIERMARTQGLTPAQMREARRIRSFDIVSRVDLNHHHHHRF